MRPIVVIAFSMLLAGAAHAQDTPPAQGDLLFISPMGEPFFGTREAPPEVAWFNGVDVNHDGKITLSEMTDDAARFFKTLDTDNNGEIGQAEIEHYETVIVPQVADRLSSSGIGYDPTLNGPDSLSDGPDTPHSYSAHQGAALFSYFDTPEPVIAADTNFNRGVSWNEFAAAAARRFRMLDANNDAVLQEAELPEPPRAKVKKKRR